MSAVVAVSSAAMAIELSRLIRAPIDEVFAFFDDPANTMRFNEHFMRYEVIDEQPDGRRVFDLFLGAGERRWVQTIGQVLREPPTRLVTRSGTWESAGDPWALTLVTDRRFSKHVDGTRLDMAVSYRLTEPWRHPVKVAQNWFQRGAVRLEYERQLDAMVRMIEGVAEPAGSPRHVPPS
jgi:uncharacterized protein YndB with AHSA1/START domain